MASLISCLQRSRALCLRVMLLALLVAAVPAQAAKFRKVVIDPGHGGHDMGGKIGYIYEKHLALDVSFRLSRYLQDKRISTVLTRSRDQFIELADRANMANRISGSIFVSIHFNWVSYGGPNGTETFYYSPESQSLASCIQSSVAAGIGTPNRGVKFARYKVLRTATVPSALMEGGFISTATERSRILDPKYRQRLAELIGEGILRYRRS